MNLWILEASTGINLYFKSFLELNINEHLVSGLLSALNQFTLTEFQDPIESIDMGGLRWCYILDKDLDLLFVASDMKDTGAELLRARLTVIQKSFIDKFIENKKKWKDRWKGQISIYNSFTEILEKYYFQWKQVETVVASAEFFDILGVFQQLLNMMRSVIENRMSEIEKQFTYRRLEEIFEKFINQPYVKHNQELSKISYSWDIGFNLITIDPSKLDDIFTVQKYIVKLISDIIRLIKEKIGNELCLVYFFREDIFAYIFNNIALLKDLNLDTFILQLLLST